jgi:hypothetical protein
LKNGNTNQGNKKRNNPHACAAKKIENIYKNVEKEERSII